MSNYKKILEEICNENGIKLERLSKDWIIKLKKDDVIKYYIGTKTSLNPYTSGKICDDKYAMFCALQSENIPVLEHKIFFNKKFRDSGLSDFASKKQIREYLKENGALVIKDTVGTKGNGVYLCTTFKDVKKAIKLLFKTKASVVVSPFYDIDIEYRCIYFDGNIELIYAKNKGENTFKHNLCKGGKATTIPKDDLYLKLEQMAINVAKVLDVEFVSIDIAHISTGELSVIEVNSGVMMDKMVDQLENGYDEAKKIYSKVIKSLF